MAARPSPLVGGGVEVWDPATDRLVRATAVPGLVVRRDAYGLPYDAAPGRRTARAPWISSGFGPRLHPVSRRPRFHKGWDIATRRGSPVLASRSGLVAFSGWRPGYGQVVEVLHRDGARTVYGHLSRRFVKEGDRVAGARTILGRVGSTGLSTGPHLHFEVRGLDGRPRDPALLLGRVNPEL